MSNNTYNGWTNYATWRVNLEMFDSAGFDVSEYEWMRKWPSMTTRSRLRALGANLASIKGTLHLNGKSIYEVV